MPKIILNDINNLTGNPTSAEQLLNENFTKLEEAIENTLSRDGTTPNALEASLDVNSQRIINVPFALDATEPVPLGQLMKLITGEDWLDIGLPAVVFYQDAEPTASAAGQVWVKTNGEIYIWSGEAWVKQQDPMLQYALTQADNAVSTAVAASNSAAAAASAADVADGKADDALAQADAIEGNLNLLSPRVLAVEQDVAATNLAIIELENEDVVLAGRIDSVTADTEDLTAAVQNEEYARIQGDTALASAIQNIQVSNAPMVFIQAAAPSPGVGGVPDPIPAYSIWYDSDDGNHQYRYVSGSWQSVQDADIGTLYGLISTETTARIDGDAAIALDVTALQTQRDSDYALIVSNNQARVDGDAALAVSINGLTTNYNNLVATIATESTARSTADNALASNISTVSAQTSANAANLSTLSTTVTTNNQARVDGDNALASSITAVNSTVGGLSTTVSQNTSAINGIQGKYAVKIDANGYVTGFGLISSNNNASPTSTFTVLAENFQIVTPGSNPVKPFYVQGGITYIRNVVIDEAAIGTATIGTLNIKDRAVTDLQPTLYNFNGAVGPSVTSNVYQNLTTTVGTAQTTVTNIAIPGSVVSLRGYFNARRAGSSGENALLRIRRNDGVVLPGILNIRLTDTYQIYAWEWIDSAPVATSHTYTVQITRPSGSGACGDWYDISLIATIAKR